VIASTNFAIEVTTSIEIYLSKLQLRQNESSKLTYDAKVMAHNVDPYFSLIEGCWKKTFLPKDRAFSPFSNRI
jgi:hypothetical protein